MLVGFQQRGIRPDLIIFADVGAERKATYEQPEFDAWLSHVGFPPVTVVRYEPQDFKHWPPYHTLEENCLTNVTFPSIAYGFHTCSSKWKITAINKWIHTWPPALAYWMTGGKLLKAIGFEDSPHEHKRAEKGCATFNIKSDECDKFELWFPLQQWGWDRERCKVEIAKAGVPVPPKSSCYFCTAMKPFEVDTLEEDKLKRIVVIEARVAKRNLEFARERAESKGEDWDGKPLTEGLWRKAVKGHRGAVAKPGSMTEYIRQKRLLPSEEIDRIIAATPTQPFTQADFERMGFSNWQQWLNSICYPQTN